MPGDVKDVILLALQASFLVAAVIVVHSRPAVGIPIALAGGLSGYWTSAAITYVGRIAVYPADAAAGVLLAATIAGFVSGRGRAGQTGWWWVFFSLSLIAFARGASLFGLETAGVSSRQVFWFIAPVLFFGSRFDIDEAEELLRRWWLRAAFVLALAAALFWLRQGLGTYAESGERGLNSAQALVVAQAVVLVMLQYRRPARSSVRVWVLPMLGVALLVLTQQRTVWVVAAVSVAFLAVSARLARPVLRRRARVAVSLSVVGVVVVMIIGPASLQASLVRATTEPTTSVSTLNWRVQGWAVLSERRRAAPLIDVLLGQPAGEGFRRVVGSTEVVVSPHNQYVATFVSLGVIGLALFLAGYLVIIHGLRRRARAGGMVDEAALNVLILGQLVFFLAYQVSLEQGVIAGLACGLGARPRLRHVPSGTSKCQVSEKAMVGGRGGR